MNSPVSAMSGALEQMRAMSAQASGKTGLDGGASSLRGAGGLGGLGGAGGASEAGAVDGDSFASMLQASLAKVSEAQNHSVSQAHAFETGSSDVSLSDVMIDMQKANIQFQTALQVRNKLVSAYTDVMQMQV